MTEQRLNRTIEKRPEDVAQLENAPVEPSRLIALFRPHAKKITLITGLIIGTSLLTVAQPFLVRRTVDEAIPHHDVPLLVSLVGAMIALAVVAQACGVFQTWLSTRVGQLIMHTLRVEVFANLQRQSMNFFTRQRGGEVQSRLTNDISGMQSVVTTTATAIASNLTMTVATVAAMIALSPTLSLLSLLVLPPAVYLTRRTALARRKITAKHQRVAADMQQVVTENLSVSGMRLAATMGAQRRVREEFERVSLDLIDLELESQLAGRWRMALMQVIFAVIPALVYLVAGLPATSNGMTIGTLIAFSTLQTQIFRPVTGLLDVGAQWVASMALFSRIFEYLDLEPELSEPKISVANEIASADLVIDSVSYTYPDSDIEALSSVSLEIPDGTTTALVGRTGSGKSTLAALVARLADPTQGEIRVGGVSLREISAEDRAGIIGVVSQETYLLHDSIRENLLFAAPQASESDMWRALESAQIAHVIRELPEGLDTVVGARGFRFSGGEQQRMSLARVLLRQPKILILDEATSALDNATERAIGGAMNALGMTKLVIAHRLSTVADADSIVVLEHGRVAEVGQHEELLERHGPYAELINSARRADAIESLGC